MSVSRLGIGILRPQPPEAPTGPPSPSFSYLLSILLHCTFAVLLRRLLFTTRPSSERQPLCLFPTLTCNRSLKPETPNSNDSYVNLLSFFSYSQLFIRKYFLLSPVFDDSLTSTFFREIGQCFFITANRINIFTAISGHVSGIPRG